MTPTEMPHLESTGVERLYILRYRGERIVLLDFVGAVTPAETVRQIRAVREWFSRQSPTGELRTLTDVTGAHYNAEVMEALKGLAAHNKPFVGAAAGVVQTALHRLAMNLAGIFSGRKFWAFTTREDALEWLVSQKLEPLRKAS
jgi:hypothetical protein